MFPAYIPTDGQECYVNLWYDGSQAIIATWNATNQSWVVEEFTAPIPWFYVVTWRPH